MATSSASELEQWLVNHPNDAKAWITLGNLRQEQHRQEDALDCYQKAVTADPTSIPARRNLGYLQFNLGLPEAAAETYDELQKQDASPLNQLLAASVLPIVYDSIDHLTYWRSRQTAALQQLSNQDVRVDASRQPVPTAFYWPYQGQNDVDIMRTRGLILRGDERPFVKTVPDHSASRIRIGFLSAYLKDHTIGRLNIGRVEQLDRRQFHVTVCLAGTDDDALTKRFAAAADQFVRIPRAPQPAAELLRSLHLDILLFCDVGMDALCSTLAWSRFAPVQCATWGHPETTGSPTMDYFLSCALLDVPDAQSHYTEQLIRMPLLGTWYERPAAPAFSPGQRTVPGLPAHGRIYACPQSLFKFHPEFDSILQQVLEQDRDGTLIGIAARN
ncbi:MAG: tetratricopeptide repeat protein, partial [Planctomycetaceae bacterium]|nr:tetratricopeptide repeat protein [Planctomycetaceae bacterium]